MKIKNDFLAFFITRVLLLVTVVVIIGSCSSLTKKQTEKSTVKLPESMFVEDDDGVISSMVKFEYDSENRIVKVSHYRYLRLSFTRTITYGSNKVMVSVEHFDEHIDAKEADYLINYIITGNTINFTLSNGFSGTITLNEKGNISNIKSALDDSKHFEIKTYQYKGGNLSSTIETGELNGQIDTEYRQINTEYKCGNNKTPFHNDKTPKWLLQYIFWEGLNNNITLLSNNITTLEYKYEYDADGFPTKQTRIHAHGGETEYETTRFKYSNGMENKQIKLITTEDLK